MLHLHLGILFSVLGYLTTTTLWLHLRHYINYRHLADILFLATSSILLTLILQRHLHRQRQSATALATRTTQYESILQTALDSFQIVDRDGRILEVNDASCTLLGYTRDELLRLSVSDLEAAETPDETAQHMQQILTKGRHHFQTRHRRKDGRIVDLDMNVTYSPVAGGRFFAFIRDITAAKETERTLTQHAEQLESVRSLSDAIARELNLPSVLSLIATQTHALTHADSCSIWLWNPDTETLSIAARSGTLSIPVATRLRYNEGLVGVVAARREGQIIEDYTRFPQALVQLDSQPPISSAMAYPLLCQEELVGVIVCTHHTPSKRFAPADVTLLRLLSTQAATAIQKARLFQDTKTQHEQLETVHRVTQDITRELDLSQLLRLISEHVRTLLATDRCTIWLWNEAEGILESAARAGSPPHPNIRNRTLNQGVAGIVASTRKGFFVNDYAAFPGALPEAIAEHTVNCISEPLLYRSELIGVIVASNYLHDRPFTEHHLTTLRLFAAQAAIAIENARLYTALSTELEQRRRTEAELLTSETRLHRLIDTANEGILTMDVAGTITSLNPKMANLLGYTSEELQGRSYFDLITPAERADVRTSFYERSHGHPAQSERTFLTKTGAPCILLVSASPLFDPDGEFAGAFGMYTDITARKAAEAALQQRMAELEAARALTSEITRERQLPALFRLTLERVATLLRGTSASLYLWSEPTQLLTRHAWTPEPQDHGSLSLQLGQGIVGQVAQDRRGMIVNDYPSYARALPEFLQDPPLIAVLAEPLIYRDTLIGVLAVSREAPTFTEADASFVRLFAHQIATAIDNAQLYAAQHQAYADLQHAQVELVQTEKLRALGQLSAGIAHDLNNTLSAIITMAELFQLRQPAMASELQSLCTVAHDGAHIVRRLREFSRQETELTLLPIHLPTAVTDALDITRPHWRDEAQRRGASIQVTSDLQSLPHILGSPSEVREALTNLILNAVDAMPTGGFLHFSGINHPAVNGTSPYVEFSIRDTGSGIPEDVRPHIFDPFFTTKGPQGTGMGLAIVYSIMERHGGKISVLSEPGHGTTFTLQFQVADPPQPAPLPAPLTRTATALRILVVDDNPHVRGPLVQVLTAIGHIPEEVTSAAAALAYIAEHPPDLIITDLSMPDMNGLNLAAAIHASYPRIPVILHTGWQDASMLNAEVQHGTITAVLEKPIDIRKLSAIIDQYCPTP